MMMMMAGGMLFIFETPVRFFKRLSAYPFSGQDITKYCQNKQNNEEEGGPTTINHRFYFELRTYNLFHSKDEIDHKQLLD